MFHLVFLERLSSWPILFFPLSSNFTNCGAVDVVSALALLHSMYFRQNAERKKRASLDGGGGSSLLVDKFSTNLCLVSNVRCLSYPG